MDEWFLLKAGTTEIFGPKTLGELRIWAAEAKLSPMDRVSNDGRKSWTHAPMVSELQMDWLVELQDNSLYGPTSVGTLQEFLATGEIDENVTVINSLDGTRSRIKELPFFKASPHRVRGPLETPLQHPAEAGAAPAGSSTGMHQRCQWLERQVMELQRDIALWQERAQSLRQQFIEATGTEPR